MNPGIKREWKEAYGMVLEGAYSIARDSKGGWIPASRRDIVESADLTQAE